MVRQSTEVAVVGAGVVGLCAAYSLRRRGVDFRLFEAAAPGSGQSAGRTRVFRHGHDDERLVRMALEAREEWGRLEEELGVRLLGRQGVLVCGPQVEARAAAFEAAGVPARLLDRAGQLDALPAFDPPEDRALLDELGGYIDVRGTIDSLTPAVRDRLVAAQVFGVEPCGGGVDLRTSEGIWSAGRAIVCAGAQTPELARGLSLDIALELELHTRATFPVRAPGHPLACLRDGSGTHGEVVYASPLPDGLRYAIGLASDEEPPVEDALGRLTRYAARAFPGLEPEPAEVRLCRTSILPWGADGVGLWRAGGVGVLAGANLFKFGPLLGELLADDDADGRLAPEQQLGRTYN